MPSLSICMRANARKKIMSSASSCPSMDSNCFSRYVGVDPDAKLYGVELEVFGMGSEVKPHSFSIFSL